MELLLVSVVFVFGDISIFCQISSIRDVKKVESGKSASLEKKEANKIQIFAPKFSRFGLRERHGRREAGDAPHQAQQPNHLGGQHVRTVAKVVQIGEPFQPDETTVNYYQFESKLR